MLNENNTVENTDVLKNIKIYSVFKKETENTKYPCNYPLIRKSQNLKRLKLFDHPNVSLNPPKNMHGDIRADISY